MERGDKFYSFEDLQLKLARYSEIHHADLHVHRSKTLEAAKRNVPRKIERAKSSLKYYNLDYRCIHGGKYRKTGHGVRQSTTLRKDCPFRLRVKLHDDGNSLFVTDICEEHNHEVSEVLYRQLPRERRMERRNKCYNSSESSCDVLLDHETSSAVDGILPEDNRDFSDNDAIQRINGNSSLKRKLPPDSNGVQSVNNKLKAPDPSGIQSVNNELKVPDPSQSVNNKLKAPVPSGIQSVVNELKHIKDNFARPVILQRMDECDIFSNYIAVQLRELSLLDRIDAKDEIQQILSKYRKKAILAQNSSTT